MAMIQTIGSTADRVMATLISGLEREFGHGAGEALAHRFLEAEEADFLWDARMVERWLGTYRSLDEEDCALDRIAIIGRLEHRWFVATMIVDGQGEPHGMIGKRTFRLMREAYVALAIA